jgi:hypothetical protein
MENPQNQDKPFSKICALTSFHPQEYAQTQIHNFPRGFAESQEFFGTKDSEFRKKVRGMDF